jgi:hypothetical protein
LNEPINTTNTSEDSKLVGNNDLDLSNTIINSDKYQNLKPITEGVHKVEEYELSNTCLFINHSIAGLLPPVMAFFLSDEMMAYISTATGFLAPSFTLIFPLLITIFL